MEINVAEEFSRTPGGRYRSEGAWSGEEFRQEHLKPGFLHARLTSTPLTVILDGTFGYSTGWLDEVFGGLAEEFGVEDVSHYVQVISKEEPYLVEDIQGYIQERAES